MKCVTFHSMQRLPEQIKEQHEKLKAEMLGELLCGTTIMAHGTV